MATSYLEGECLFEGALTRVSRAQRSDGTSVAIKQLRELYPSQARLARFTREFEITRSAAGEGVIGVHEFRTEDGAVSIVLEDFEATSLAQLARERGRLPLVEVLEIGVQVARALARVHRLDVVHKDVNPSNIVWNPERRVAKLIDFGISQVLSREATFGEPERAFEGTPNYMSPEQTGRMNRAVDCRSDLYSLGATLFELVTGRPPFEFDDRLQLVHAHIARTPPLARTLVPSVPLTLSRIIATLLEKRAENRYQSAAGLEHDLATCLEQVRADRVEAFPLRRHDVEERLRVPQKLYGRDREVQLLLEAFEFASSGRSRVMLVGGYSGIGKTSFVHEVHRSLVGRRGRFVQGKFDQFDRGTPYDSLIQAFRELARQSLAGERASIQGWRQRILAAVGSNGRVLTEVIPEAEHLIGIQPPVERLSPAESRNRFHLVLARFVSAMASAERPLVIFLDDLQWADLPSIELITSLASDPSVEHVLWIGAYRDNEVGPDHPLSNAIAELRAQDAQVEEVTLGPLSETDVIQLVSETVLGAPGHARLAMACHDKTGGNAFFLNRFLEALHAAGHLRFDAGAGAWTWDLARIRAQTMTSNVVEFMASEIQRLPREAARALELAACVGNRFDLGTLATLLEVTRKATLEALRPALSAELIVPAQEGFWFAEEVDEATTNFACRFAHDRVRQSAYGQLEASTAAETHHRIGELLLAELSQEEQTQRLFEIVEHLNRGLPPEDVPERDRLCDLNLAAARRATSSAAFQPAHAYLQRAYELLGEDGWTRRYEVALAIHVEGARAAHLSGEGQVMGARVAAVMEHGRTLLHRVQAQEVKIYALVSQQRFSEVVDCALGVLSQLGVELSEEPSLAEVEEVMGATLAELTPERLSAALALPELEDPSVVAAMRIMNGIMSSTYLARPTLLPLLACHIVRETLSRGPCGQSAYGFTVFALALVSEDQIETAYRIGLAARQILARWSERSEHPRVLHVLTMMVDPWVTPLRDSIEFERSVIELAVDTGDLEYASWGLQTTCGNSFYAGVELSSLGPTTARHQATLVRQKQLPALACTAPFKQAILNLRGQADDPARLVGPEYDEEEQFEALRAIDFRGALLVLHAVAVYVRYLFRDLESAREWATRGFEFRDGAGGTPHIIWIYHYRALTILGLEGECEAEEAAALRERLQPTLTRMETWHAASPVNHAHRLALLRAELARVEGRRGDATLLYDEAIAAARQNAFLHEEALANELAGRFHLARGSAVAARGYLLEACFCYEQWGGVAKAEHLQEEFAQLLTSARAVGLEGTHGQGTSATTKSSQDLDLRTLFKAASAISSEIRLDDLLGKILEVAIENAGATHGLLLLDDEGDLRVGVAKDADGVELVERGAPLSACSELPARISSYVARTGEVLVVNDVREDARWSGSATSDSPTSILAGPVVHQGRRRGIVCLENRLTAGAFTPGRIQLLTLLSAQAAISIENAQVYEVLEETVAERTRELADRNEELSVNNDQLEATLLRVKQMQAQIVTQEKLASLGKLVAGIAHEIKNPLNFVNNFSELQVEFTQEVLETLAANPAASLAEVSEVLSDIRENAQQIFKHGQRADSIVNGMMQHARGGAGVFEDVELNVFLEDHLRLATAGLGVTSRVTVERDFDAGAGQVPLVVRDMGRVVVNLVNNALDAVEGVPEPVIHVTTRRLPDKVQIAIRDNGEGITEQVKGRIFEPFFTTKTPGAGTGLGLSLSHDIVALAHGGTLEVSSEAGAGAEFVVSLPTTQGPSK